MSFRIISTREPTEAQLWRRLAIVGGLIFCFHITAVVSQSNMTDHDPKYPHQEEVKALSTTQNKFTRDLYQALLKTSDGNLFFSPFSILSAMAMTYMGCKTETEAQMKAVLHFTSNKTAIMKAFHDLIDGYKKQQEGYELKTSNMLYISKLITPVNEEFMTSMTKEFLASSELADFNNPEHVRGVINAAVEKETNSKIKDLIGKGVLNSLTVMVLVNAIYFKGLWEHQFDPKRTKKTPFWVTPTTSVDIPMMTTKKKFRVSRKPELNSTLLALDYKGGQVSMVIILPDERDGLKALEKKLASVDFETLEGETERTEVSVTLPKFKLEEDYQLKEVFISMGVTDLFSDHKADLSGIAGDGNGELYVSKVIHKAFLEVNEEGSEASAATGVVAMRRSLVRWLEFVADHPFVFYIRDNHSGQMLFSGRFAQPHTQQDRKDEL